MANNGVIGYVNLLINEYLNKKAEYNRIRNNMLWYNNWHKSVLKKGGVTPKQAFAFVIQSALSAIQAPVSEWDAVINTLWQTIESKNHSFTKLW